MVLLESPICAAAYKRYFKSVQNIVPGNLAAYLTCSLSLASTRLVASEERKNYDFCAE